jgi:hypothetical protein
MNTKYSLKRPPANTPKLYETDNGTDPYDKTVFAHYFLGNADWYILEYSEDEDLWFCWAEIIPTMGEFGYTCIKELDALVVNQEVVINNAKLRIPLTIQCESPWTLRTLRECLEKR